MRGNPKKKSSRMVPDHVPMSAYARSSSLHLASNSTLIIDENGQYMLNMPACNPCGHSAESSLACDRAHMLGTSNNNTQYPEKPYLMIMPAKLTNVHADVVENPVAYSHQSHTNVPHRCCSFYLSYCSMFATSFSSIEPLTIGFGLESR